MKLIEVIRKMLHLKPAEPEATPPADTIVPLEEDPTKQSLTVQVMLMSHSCCG